MSCEVSEAAATVAAVDIDWENVAARVAALAEHPGAVKVFGAGAHGFVLEPPLSGAELAELEAQLGVGLPEDYRGFLLRAGRGGAGPSYGIFPLRRGPDGWHWEGDGADMTETARLREPFPEPVDGLAALHAGQPDEEDFPDAESFDAAYEAWRTRLEDVLWTNERTVGAICLCHHGCAQREWLVVSGPERGTVWTDPRADYDDLAPRAAEDGGRTTFGAWYLAWLAEAEAEAEAGSGVRPRH
ncbi:SMI1/KNR4 family protein [Actinomadura atramentaria]|uniref:SMI1/KNR4 family protein n=1 Tax=Actinomadura atramentaria TaxID=1990 RepID=UPI001F0AE725|nr:SMI1/KNR4 family protein [Actinomadura atramentaria]